ncbi:MAG: hypothetical protein HXX09_12825 [Bacteroidetes bacterium]|nr:hypothetical protein [Bacteroidota bacterium]
MLKKISSKIILLIVLSSVLLVSSCTKDETPTKERMGGVWTVTAATNEAGADILSKIKFPVAAFYLSSDGTIISTGGPMVMYIVYGENKYTQIASQIDQCFNYTTLDFNGGEYFAENGVVDRFTLEMKLEGLPGQKSLTSLLDLLNIDAQWLKTVVYHKFINVAIDFNEDGSEMYWTIDSSTSAAYNMKDGQGNYVLWNGWPVNNFSRCSFTLTKQSKDLKDIVIENS